MNQTKLESLFEQSVSMFCKFWVAVACWKFVVAPLITSGYLSYEASIPITIIFTVLSLVQGYFWRRVFNAEYHKWVHKTVGEYYAKRSH